MNYLDTIVENVSIGENSVGGTGQMRGCWEEGKAVHGFERWSGAESEEVWSYGRK